METAQNIVVEPENEDVQAGFATFLGAALEMPRFADEELNEGLSQEWRDQISELFREAEARSAHSRD